MIRIPVLNALNFLKINLIKLSSLQEIPEKSFDNYIMRGCKTSELKGAEGIYQELNGIGFSNIQKLLLIFFSKKNLIITLEQPTNKIVSLNFYYLNKKDFIENTVHAGFIGVLSNYEGQGIATKMRQHAKSHFKKNGFSGISSRISKNNIASLKTAEKVGFIPVEEYFDKSLNEDRYYLICDLEKENDTT